MIGQYYTTDAIQTWYVNNLPNARHELSKFKILDTLFSSFRGYENKDYSKSRNVILYYCLPDFQGNPRSEKLSEVESSLLMFKLLDWKKKKLNCLSKRLCSDDFYESLSPYTELTYAKWLADRLGLSNIEIYPSLMTGKASDIKVGLNSKNVYLEIGNLSESEPEKKIQKILDEAAEYIGRKQKGTTVIILKVGLIELLVLDLQMHIDVKASIKKLTLELDRLCINELTEYEGRLDINEIAETLKYKRVMEDLLKRSSDLILPNEKEKLKLINSPAISRWINSSKGQIALGSKMVTWISRHKGKFLLVEVHPQMFYPSAAALIERDSFINHIVRHIKDQLEQLQPNSPNIIAVQGFNWVMFGLGEYVENIKPLRSKIEDFLSANKQADLSGIAIFSDDFAKSTYIPNAHASGNAKLRQEEIRKLGMKTVI